MLKPAQILGVVLLSCSSTFSDIREQFSATLASRDMEIDNAHVEFETSGFFMSDT